MPVYRFFEASKPSAESGGRALAFDEFKLHTSQRSTSRQRQSMPVRKEELLAFKARGMPDFSETYKGVKLASPKRLTSFEPFKLSTASRGQSKQQKLRE